VGRIITLCDFAGFFLIISPNVPGSFETPISKDITLKNGSLRKGTEYRKMCRKNELPLLRGTAYRYIIPIKQFNKMIWRYAVPDLNTFNPCSANLNGALHL